jgi:hypothetical protein
MSTPILEPVDLDLVYFRSGNDFYLKRTENAANELSTDGNGRIVLCSDVEDDVVHIVSRADGPAIVQKFKGITRFVYNGELHNPNGPAFIQEAVNGLVSQKLYFVFGLMINEMDFKKYNAFIKKAHDYIVKNDCALSYNDDLCTEERVVKSFDSYEDFTEAAEKGSILIESGPAEVRTTNWVKVSGALGEAGLGFGLATVALLGGAGLMLGGIKNRVKEKAAQKNAQIAEGISVGK